MRLVFFEISAISLFYFFCTVDTGASTTSLVACGLLNRYTTIRGRQYKWVLFLMNLFGFSVSVNLFMILGFLVRKHFYTVLHQICFALLLVFNIICAFFWFILGVKFYMFFHFYYVNWNAKIIFAMGVCGFHFLFSVLKAQISFSLLREIRKSSQRQKLASKLNIESS